MKFNKTVYLEDGGVEVCEVDGDKLTLSALWIAIFVLSLALNVFAIIGNSIVVLACFFQKKRPPLIIYIHALAFSDLLYALVAPLYTYRYVLQHWPKLIINFGLAGRLSHHVTLIGNTFSSISSWLVVALTIDRLILTRLPFKASVLSTPKRTYVVIFVIVLLCCAVNAVWIYEFFEVPITVLGCTGYWVIPKKVIGADGSLYIPIRYQKEYQIYAIVSAVLTMYALPTVIMIISNIFILITFNTTKVNTSVSNTQSRKRMAEIRLTKMIVTVSVVFMVCNIPDIATRLLWKFISPLIVSKVQPVAHLFLMINVGANFIVYSLFNRHLFDTILTMCRRSCCCCLSSGVMSVELSSNSSSSRSDQKLQNGGSYTPSIAPQNTMDLL